MICSTQLNRDLSVISKIDKCVIYNWPDYNNPGHHFLSLGILLYLIEQHNANILHIGTTQRYNLKHIDNADTIIFVGGNTFGDLYPKIHNTTLDIISKFPKKRIIIFPVSTFFEKSSNMIKTQNTLMKTNDLFICGRDLESYTLIEKHFKKAKKQLVCDMSFYLYDLVLYFKKLLDVSSDSLIQSDSENVGSTNDIWGEYSYHFMKILTKYVNPDYIKYPYISFSVFLSCLLQLMNHKTFKTNILHVHIMSTMLENPHIFLNRTNYKNKSFYETWTKKFDFVTFQE